MPTSKMTMNVPLKVAIVASGLSQREIALRSGIGEVRLSAIVHERKTATPAERRLLARLLGWPVRGLFPGARRRRGLLKAVSS